METENNYPLRAETLVVSSPEILRELIDARNISEEDYSKIFDKYYKMQQEKFNGSLQRNRKT